MTTRWRYTWKRLKKGLKKDQDKIKKERTRERQVAYVTQSDPHSHLCKYVHTYMNSYVVIFKQRDAPHTYIHTYIHTYKHAHTHVGTPEWQCRKQTKQKHTFGRFLGCCCGSLRRRGARIQGVSSSGRESGGVGSGVLC